MCRLFGIIANKEVDIKFSMLQASNKFKNQGRKNPHGWGIGWYKKGIPEIKKYGENAFTSQKFDELIEEIRSQIVIAHVRFASSGSTNSSCNAHPFSYKNWIFAHNGTVNKNRIFNLLKKPFNNNFTSEPIDSEIYFRFIMQNIDEKRNIIEGINEAVNVVIRDAAGANFILSNGENIYAFKYCRNLYYLIRDPQSSFYAAAQETNALIESKRLAGEKVVIVATEEITSGENWQELNDGFLLIVDKNLKIKLEKLL